MEKTTNILSFKGKNMNRDCEEQDCIHYTPHIFCSGIPECGHCIRNKMCIGGGIYLKDNYKLDDTIIFHPDIPEKSIKELRDAIQYIDKLYSCDDRDLDCPNPDSLNIALNTILKKGNLYGGTTV